MKCTRIFPVVPDLDDAQAPERSREDGGMNISMVVEPLEAAATRYNARSNGHLTGGELVLPEWNHAVEKGVGIRPVRFPRSEYAV